MNLKTINLNKEFKQKKILKDINLTFEGGHCYGLLGNNGAGKTTLTKCIFNEYKFKGNVLLNDKNLNETQLQKMYYFSDNNDLPKGLTMYSFLQTQYLLHIGNLKDFKAKLKAENSFFPTRNLKKNIIKNLSSGEQKLLSLLACKMINPEIIFFDEPTANLDISNKEIIIQEIKKIITTDRIVVIITHLIEEIKDLLDQVIILNNSSIAYTGQLSGDAIKIKFLEVINHG